MPMRIRGRIALLMLLAAAAAFTGAEAWRTLRLPEDSRLPHEIYDAYAARAESAMYFLRESEKPVGEIASNCEFVNFSYCIRLFRRRFGQSPRAYRG